MSEIDKIEIGLIERDTFNDDVRKLRVAAASMGPIKHGRTSKGSDDEHTAISELPKARREAAFSIVRESRVRSQHQPLQPSTLADYAKKFAQLKLAMIEDYVENELDRWLTPLARYIGVSSSYKAYKSALCWGLREQIKEDLALQDKMQRDGSDALVWEGVVQRLAHTTSLLKDIDATTRDAPYWENLNLKAHRGKSKRYDLAVLERTQPLWLLRFLLGMRRTYYLDAIYVLLLCGCRPEELEKGVRIAWSGTGDFTLHVNGAKVTQTSGQPWRLFSFDSSALPKAWAKKLARQGSIEVRIASKDALRRSMTDVSKRVLRGLPIVTAIVFRHLLSNSLRENDSDRPGVSESLGHLVSETQAYYGFKPKRGKRRRPSKRLPTGVVVPREVRPPSRTSLDKLLQKKDVVSKIWKPR